MGAVMYKYDKLQEFFYQQSDKSKAGEEEKLKQIWEEKFRLIDKVMRSYWNLLHASLNCREKRSNFDHELKEAENLMNKRNHDVSLNYSSDKDSPFGEDSLIEIFKQMLSPDYDPKKVDIFERQYHLFALWFYYKMMPVYQKKPFPYALGLKLDLCLTRLSTVCTQTIMAFIYEGKHFDFEGKRHKSRREKREHRRSIIYKIYHGIDQDRKRPHRIATEIQEKWPNDEQPPPSIDTIKNRLKEGKFHPFYKM
jgi:hypothetical protein